MQRRWIWGSHLNEHVSSNSGVDPSWSSIDAAIGFLKLVRPRGPWNLTAVGPDKTGAESATFTDAAKAKAWLTNRIGRMNMYYMPNAAPQPTGAAGRARKADVSQTEFRHVDIDLDKLAADHEWHELDLAGRKARMLEKLRAFREPGPPSLVIDSGGGLQPLWRLAKADNVADDDLAGRQNEKLGKLLGGDPGTHNIDRLLRLPGTPNLPDSRKRQRGRVAAPAVVVESNDRTYDAGAFTAAEPRVTADVDDIVIGAPEEVSDLASLAVKYGLSQRVQDIVRDGRLHHPKDGDDSRSAWLFDCVCDLVRHKVPLENIVGIITDREWGISESVVERGDDADRYAERTVRNAVHAIRSDVLQDFGDDVDFGDVQKPSISPSRDKYRRLSLMDLLELPSPRWLVKDWITEGGLFGVFGGEKSYKTFLLLDMFLRASVGMDWHGIPMLKSRVQYIIGEGNARRFADRIMAWCIHNGVTFEEASKNFMVVPVRVGVDNDAERKAFMAADHSRYDVTIFDTMARNMDGDENSTRDMSKTIASIDEIPATYGSAGGFAHHTGKDVSKGARGSSALAGAVDALIEVKHNQATGEAVMTLYRSRDSEQGVSRVFKPKRVLVSESTDQEMRYSLVMEFVREGTGDDKKAAERPITADAKTALEKILVYLAEHDGVANQNDLESDEPGMSHANVNKAFAKLRAEKLVSGTGPIFCTKKGRRRALELGAVIDADIDE